MVNALGKRGVRVRGIWIADVAWQGQSGILNEDVLGNDRKPCMRFRRREMQ